MRRTMKHPLRSSRLNPLRWLPLGAAIVWGLVEFLALQRSRYSSWRIRS